MKKITFLFAFLLTGMFSLAQMSGTYTVGTGGTYATLKAAADNLNTVGINGDVLFQIVSDISETSSVKIAVANPSYIITIKPAATLTPIITFSGCTTASGSTQYSGFAVENTSYVIIDGSNTNGGTTQDLTFLMNDATNGRNIIQFYGNCDNSAVKNLKIMYSSPMSTANSTRGIYLNGQGSGVCDNFSAENCIIGNETLTPYYSVSATGYSTGSIFCSNVNIKNNKLYGRIRPIYLYYVGTTGTTSEVSGNTIYTYGGNNANTTYTIMGNAWAGTLNVFNNKMPVITTNNTATSGIFGFSFLSAQSGATTNVYNNFIGGTLAATGTGAPSVISLMYLQDNGTYNVNNNTFYYPSLTNQNVERSCIHISGSAAKVNLNNNIIINETDAANAYCIWKSNGTLTSDYNNLYVSGATANIGYVTSTARKTLADWQTAGFNYDKFSKSVPVTFADAPVGDLHLKDASVNDVNLAAPLIATVTTDIDGNLRTALTYKGANQASDMTAVAKQFTVTVPNGTEKVYVAGDFTGKFWDVANPFQLIKTANPNEFTEILPCVTGVEYKYLCETGDWDYQEGVFNDIFPPTMSSNRAYNPADNVPVWYRVNKITLNATPTPQVANLWVKGSWDDWATGIEMTQVTPPSTVKGTDEMEKVKSETNAVSYSVTLGGNPGDKFPANTEYKYYTNVVAPDNWEVGVDGLPISNRWAIAPVMNDLIPKFGITTDVATPTLSARILRTYEGVQIELEGTSTVEIYTTSGMLIEKVRTSGTYTKELNTGVYIIRIDGQATKFMK